MPAITVENPLTLPRITDPTAGTHLDRGSGDGAAADSRIRPVTRIVAAPSGLEGEGFPVRRAFAGIPMNEVDPFVHMDQMGAIEYAPGEPKGTPWHPHRGFETVTYMIDGTFQHQDSIGGGGLIKDGATQWMTAGSGILHIERPPEEMIAAGGLFHGIQLWVNLPSSTKMTAPRYQDITPHAVTLLTSPDGGALIRVIAGELDGHGGPGHTHTPITLVHATLRPGARLVLPWPKDHNALAYVLAGTGSVGPDDVTLTEGHTAVFGPGDALGITADQTQPSTTPDLEVLMLGGRPIGEPVATYGPFVMNTRAELAQAFEDFEAGRLGTIPADHIGR